MNMFEKTADSIKNKGLASTIVRILTYPLRRQERRRQKEEREKNWSPILSLKSIEDRFTAIYQKNLWGSSESVSGTGSTVNYTENIRSEIPFLIEEFGVKKIFDAPCGDFNWMRMVLERVQVAYIGGDIVEPLISKLNKRYKKDGILFIHINIVEDVFPSSDLMICRDCLFHLSYEDIKSILENFIESRIPYLLTTTHKNIDGFKNRNIITGDFRAIDLFSEPFNFPADPLKRIDDWQHPEPEREMCLWTRAQVISALEKFQINSSIIGPC